MLNQFLLGLVRLGQVMFRLCFVRFDQVRLGQIQVRLVILCLDQFLLGLVRLGQVQISFCQVWLGQVGLCLGQFLLGLVRLGQVRFRLGQLCYVQISFCQVRLGQVRLGQVRSRPLLKISKCFRMLKLFYTALFYHNCQYAGKHNVAPSGSPLLTAAMCFGFIHHYL